MINIELSLTTLAQFTSVHCSFYTVGLQSNVIITEILQFQEF